MNDKSYNVLFLCTGNSARSILAEAILNQEGNGNFNAYSAGSNPTGKVNPFAVELLENLGIDTSFARSKVWDEFSGSGAPEMHFVFTVCDNAAGEACPVWIGHPMTAHWGVPDPAAAEGSDAEKRVAFSEAYRQLYARITTFASLPIESIDKLSLQNKLSEIGKMDEQKDSA